MRLQMAWTIQLHSAAGQSLRNSPQIEYTQSNPWQYDRVLYQERHLVENFFLKWKHFRRAATGYDNSASFFLSFSYIASIAILLK